MELFINTHTKECSIHRDNIIQERPEPRILTLSISKKVYQILTNELSLEEYYNLIDELILTARMKMLPKAELEKIIYI